jgi:FkbM family methyltransferase
MIDPLASSFPNIRGAGRAARVWSSFAAAVGLSPSRIVSMRLGHKLILDRRSNTERWPFYSGIYDDDVIEDICHLTPSEKYFLDVGANVGLFSIPIAMKCKQKRCCVIAFEPAPGNFERLERNIALNGLKEVVSARQMGLSSKSGIAALTLREDYTSGSPTGTASIQIDDDGLDAAWNTVNVPLAALDEFWDNEPIGVIKIDIEGHEDEFLLGAQKTILKWRPIIYMEINNWFFKRKNKSLQAACEYLVRANYLKFLRRKSSSPESVSDLDAFPNLENVWLVPNESVGTFLAATRKSHT